MIPIQNFYLYELYYCFIIDILGKYRDPNQEARYFIKSGEQLYYQRDIKSKHQLNVEKMAQNKDDIKIL